VALNFEKKRNHEIKRKGKELELSREDRSEETIEKEKRRGTSISL